MMPHRLPQFRTLACACILILAGLSGAAGQSLPMPGQETPNTAFPPPPGQSSVFPPPPGQTTPRRGQTTAFPPPPAQSSVFAPPPGQAAPRPSQATAFPPPSGRLSAFPPPPRQAAPQRGGQASAFPPPGGQNICATFPAIRAEVEKGANSIKAAGDRKATRDEVCPLFKRFAAKEAKMLKFLESNRTICGIPAKAIKQVKVNHSNTIRIRNQVCAARPPAPPPGPTLSDAIGGPIIADDTSANKPGRSTFDTLTGNVLAR